MLSREPEAPDPQKLLTLQDLATRWGVSPITIDRLTQNTDLPVVRIGRQKRFLLRDVETYERANRS
jgi:excisionase family DNA binding protein